MALFYVQWKCRRNDSTTEFGTILQRFITRTSLLFSFRMMDVMPSFDGVDGDVDSLRPFILFYISDTTRQRCVMLQRKSTSLCHWGVMQIRWYINLKIGFSFSQFWMINFSFCSNLVVKVNLVLVFVQLRNDAVSYCFSFWLSSDLILVFFLWNRMRSSFIKCTIRSDVVKLEPTNAHSIALCWHMKALSLWGRLSNHHQSNGLCIINSFTSNNSYWGGFALRKLQPF